jgi:hypothetical protein
MSEENTEKGAPRTLEHVSPPWSVLIAACKDCEAYSKSLLRELKMQIKAHDASPRGVRIVKTSCQKVCPKNGLTISVQNGADSQTIVLRDALDATLCAEMITRR